MVKKEIPLDINTPELRNMNAYSNGKFSVNVIVDIPELDELQKRLSNLEKMVGDMGQVIGNQQVAIDGLSGKVSQIKPVAIIGAGTNTANVATGQTIPFGSIYRVSNGESVDSLPIRTYNGYIVAKRDCTIYVSALVKMQFAGTQTRYAYVDFRRVRTNNVVDGYDGARIGDHFTRGTANNNRLKDFQNYLPAHLVIDLKANETLSLELSSIENNSTIYYGNVRDTLVTILSDSI